MILTRPHKARLVTREVLRRSYTNGYRFTHRIAVFEVIQDSTGYIGEVMVCASLAAHPRPKQFNKYDRDALMQAVEQSFLSVGRWTVNTSDLVAVNDDETIY